VAYALIPDGYSLKKVTKLQDKAVNAKRRHDNSEALLANPNTPLVIGGLIGAFFGVRLAEDIIKDIESRVGALSDDVKQGIKDTVDIKLPTFGAPVPVTPTVSDLIDFIKREIA
jgi:hypothetical protein